MKKLGSTLAESAAHVTSPPIAARGFTLAETLITLGIIGIIAAITIPSLITKYRRTVASTKLKKFYSTINQAIRQSIAENDDIVYMDLSDVNSNLNGDKILTWYKENLIKYMTGVNIDKYPNSDRYVKCYFNDGTGFISYLQAGDGLEPRLWFFYCLDASSPSCKPESYDGNNTFLFRYFPNKKIVDTGGSGSKIFTGCLNKNPHLRHVCSEWIKQNGWEIPHNYPWIK